MSDVAFWPIAPNLGATKGDMAVARRTQNGLHY
jgi:hypothetical protein